MKRTLAGWMRATAAFVPSGVGAAVAVGAWLALTALFTFVGNVLLLAVVTTIGRSLGPAVVPLTVVGVFGTPAVSLALARSVVAAAVQRIEPVLVRDGDATPGGELLGSCESNERTDCRTAGCC